MSNSTKEIFKLFIESGWVVTLVGSAGMLARLIASPIKNASCMDYFKKILVAAITSTIAWLLIEQLDISSVTKAITYGVIGVISPEIIYGLINLSKFFSKNPQKFFGR